MNLRDCAIDTEFWTAYACVHYGQVSTSVHRWKLVSPEHGIGVLMTPAGPANHTRMMESNDRIFATEQEAWQDVANQLSAVVGKIQAAIETCGYKPTMNEAA